MLIARMRDEKRRYRRYKARMAKLPEKYREAVAALEHYFMYFAPDKGEELVVMLEDLGELFENSAAEGISIREIVGDDPVEFVEAFRRNYPKSKWIEREEERLTKAIRSVTQDEAEA